MSKFRSVICLFLISAIIAVMCFFCTVSFPLKGDINTSNSVIAMTERDSVLGGSMLSDEKARDGGYSTAYYPEGVISAKEYEENAEENDYQDKYTKHNGVYLKNELLENGEVTQEFRTSFEKTAKAIAKRYDALGIDSMRVDTGDDYTVRVYVPALYSSVSSLFSVMAYTGEVSVYYGSDESSATKLFPENKRDAVIGDYIKSFSSQVTRGTAYVNVKFTSLGRQLVKSATADASSSSSTMFFKIGDNTVIPLGVSSEIDIGTLHISGSYTKDTAHVIAVVMNDALKMGGEGVVSFTQGEVYRVPARGGNNAFMLACIALAVCFVLMAVFFFVRYGRLAFAHLLTYLLFFFSMIFCIWAIPFLYFSAGSVLAVMLASVVLAIGDILPYEYARKEFAAGRTMASSVKSAYKKTLWYVIDLHVVLAALAFIIYGISFAGASVFAFTFGLGVAFSLVCSLGVGRLNWASTMAFTPKKGAFCRFRREEVEDD